MSCIPTLQSWCIIPPSDSPKFTKAHRYLQSNPSIVSEIIKRNTLIPQRAKSFRVLIKRINDSQNIDPIDLINTLSMWDLIDIIDFKRENNGSIEVRFRSPISAHIATRIPNLIALALDEIPKQARVPLIYIQGIGADANEEGIRSFFRTMTPILRIKKIQKGKIFVHILKLPSVRNALKVSQLANHQNYGNLMMVVSHQYKSTVTQCFFITSIVETCLPLEEVRLEVSQFGEIEIIFKRSNGDFTEFYIKMKNTADAKLACGIMNGRSYGNAILSSIFISPEFFDEVYSAFNT